MSEARSHYRYKRIAPGGGRVFLCHCVFCNHVDERAIPLTASVGLYFTWPIKCPQCSKWSIHYKGKGSDRAATQQEG